MISFHALIYLVCNKTFVSRANLLRHTKGNCAQKKEQKRGWKKCAFCDYPDKDTSDNPDVKKGVFRDANRFGRHVLRTGCWTRILDMHDAKDVR